MSLGFLGLPLERPWTPFGSLWGALGLHFVPGHLWDRLWVAGVPLAPFGVPLLGALGLPFSLWDAFGSLCSFVVPLTPFGGPLTSLWLALGSPGAFTGFSRK